ncbi:MAG: thioredoxin family protein [Bacteroidales bacterium]|nr:thioredoxin family protein [Bacteroidales bacterium]MBN2748238.1 thioredoxin family protein [Bacteroidales bacterium]
MNISSVIESERYLKETAIALYFTTPTCSVCHSLKPHVQKLLSSDFPKIQFHEVDIPSSPEVCGHFTVFTAPTLIIFFEGKEFKRFTRAFGVAELKQALERPYKLLFS